jgi:hypothetical protein
MTSRIKLTLGASLMLAVAGCVGSPVIVATPSACSTLLPAEWEQGVGHAASPDAAPAKPTDQPGLLAWTLNELKKWTGFAVEEAAHVDQADGRTKDAIGIVERCEARDAAAVKKSTRGFFGRIFG